MAAAEPARPTACTAPPAMACARAATGRGSLGRATVWHDRPGPGLPRGFSLLEVLGALALLALLLLGVYAGIRTATQSVRAGTAAIDRLDRIRAAQAFLRRELAQAMAQPIGRDERGDALYFSGNAHELRFVAPLPGYLGKRGPQLQTLTLVDDGHGGQRLEIRFAALATGGEAAPAQGRTEVLLEGVHEGAFAYRGVDARGQPGDWQSDWPDGRLLPALVRIELKAPAPEHWPPLVAPLRVDAGASLGRPGLLQRLRPLGGAR
ncbi:MAG: prepilin-type N-terminal cleavage/methylation domain-containing protein [Fulvimonas sp.]|nr:prepilin-type N-terminal cleavage/methylation domain-containing protein [Fulvimonas sp.]